MLASGSYCRHFYIVFYKWLNHLPCAGVGFCVLPSALLYCLYKCWNHLRSTGVDLWALPSALLYCVVPVFEPLEEHWRWRLGATIGTCISCFASV